MQRKWSTTEQEAYGVYYTITKWNYYLQGADIIVRNDQKPLNKFLNGKNANNKANRLGLELATYNITFKWISGACNKAADCLSHLVELPQDKLVPVNMLSATNTDRPAFNTRSQTHQHHSLDTSTSQPDVTSEVTAATDPTPKSLTTDRLQALLQMQKMDPFCKRISKHLSNRKAPQHETDLFIHVKVSLYKHVSDSNQKFLTLVIPKAWKYTVVVEGHDKLGHQGTIHTYCLIKWQYYGKGMKKDISKYITNYTLCCTEKAKVQAYPLQMTEILDRPFDKITIDLITECETSSSGNKHILTIIDHLTGWPEAFPIPDKSAVTIVSTFINQYLPVHMCPRYILSNNGTEFKNQLMDKVLQQFRVEQIFSTPYQPQSNGKLEVFHKYLNPP